ncbi:hypothetical protein [Piscirickettsia litoralis]|uniref:Intracellular multiplication protein IcmG n=1 Tax=Piscirickettsia litoralis TaxID=1891921 RepID=A0ABX3ACG6_9GAMM|nr:hypothetical protein [Piscirickettsia litoralis]ODN43859.1 hypothetical protein BGC07_14390 [Piscirickettsia litoralis]
MNEIDENYNFDDDISNEEDVSIDELIEQDHDENTLDQKVSLWEKIKPMLHYYIIAVIAFTVAGYMIYNAYQTLYPVEKNQVEQNKNLNFSSKTEANKVKYKSSSINNYKNKGINDSYKINYKDDSNKEVDDRQLLKGFKETNNKIIKINNSLSDIKSILNQRGGRVGDDANFKNKLNDINKNQDDIKYNLKLLYKNIESINLEMSEFNKVIRINNKKIEFLIANQYGHREKLKLRAIVTGRAWLVNKNGVIFTVTKNMKIPGYGYVVEVNDKKEQVLMSSGYIFN